MLSAKIRTALIDDEYFNRELIKLMISHCDDSFDIVAEADGMKEGIKMLESAKPDVVFLDIKMPDGTGFELLEQIGRVDFQVVFITGFDDQYDVSQYNQALDYILKPIDQDKLRQTLQLIKKILASQS